MVEILLVANIRELETLKHMQNNGTERKHVGLIEGTQMDRRMSYLTFEILQART